MTQTPIRPAKAGDSTFHADFVTSLTDMADFYDANPSAPRPSRIWNIPLGGGTRADRVAALYRAAKGLGVEVADEDGVLYVRKDFGDITLGASVAPEKESHDDCIARLEEARRRRDAVAA